MVDVEKATHKISELALLKYFPQDEFAQRALVRMICERAKTNEQIDWLVARVFSSYNEWPGPEAVLGMFDSPMMPGNMKPLSEADRRKVLEAAGEQKLIGDGTEPPEGKVTADPMIQTAFEVLRAVQTFKEQGWDRPITQEEIDSAPDWLKRLEGYDLTPKPSEKSNG